MDAQLVVLSATIGVGALVVLIVAWAVRRMMDQEQQQNSTEQETEPQQANGKPAAAAANNKKQSTKNFKTRTTAADTFTHPWLVSNLKGHSHAVTDMDFASNGKYLVTAGTDSSLILWHTKDLAEKEHKTSRGAIEMEQAALVRFGPDSRSLLLHLARTNRLGFYKLSKKEGSTVYKFEPVDSVRFDCVHTRDIEHIGFACTGQFVMSASSDTSIVLYDIKGHVLNTIDTKQSALYSAAVSPCGRFVAAAGFTPDVKIWHVTFDRSANFTGAKRAFDLKGHNSGVWSLAFNQDSTRMLTASKDGTWRFWDTDIRFQQGEEAVVMFSGEWSALRSASHERVRTALAPDGQSFVIAIGTSLRLYAVPADPKAPDVSWSEIADVFNSAQVDGISSCRFTPDAQLVAVAGDRHVRILRNVPGLRAQIERLRQQLQRPQGDAHKRRLEEQIAEAEKELKHIEN